MARVEFRTSEGARHVVEAKAGMSLMSQAKARSVPGVVAECGGSMVCGTCHVYIDEPWFARLPPPSAMEAALVDNGLYPRANSRLSCQILVTEEMDGMTVEIPIAQG